MKLGQFTHRSFPETIDALNLQLTGRDNHTTAVDSETSRTLPHTLDFLTSSYALNTYLFQTDLFLQQPSDSE